MSGNVVPFPDGDQAAEGAGPLLPKSEYMNFIEFSELIGWRRVSGRVLLLVEEVIAQRGDRADDDLIKLQHEIVQLSAAPGLVKMATDFSHHE